MPASPSLVRIPGFTITGLQVRTRNRDEADPATARIGALWDQFFSRSWERELPGAGTDGCIYGVYSGYESDAHGAYDVTAGVRAQPAAAPLAEVAVQPGDYLVFHAQGAMPQMVIDGWTAVWRHFAGQGAPRRRFGTDFERYEGPDRVAIHIGIAT